MKASELYLLLAATANLVQAQSPVWGQCGGTGWTGATTCAADSTCVKKSEWYSQCIPGDSGGGGGGGDGGGGEQPSEPPPTAVDGLIGYGVGTTGGGSASPKTVTSCQALKDAVKGTTAAVVRINGMLSGCGHVTVGSNKSILGVGSNSGLTNGGLLIENSKNVIVRNLVLGPAPAFDDIVEISTSTYVWIDHCTFKSLGLVGDKDDFDGQLDIVRGSDFVTVSWNIFRDHWKCNLIGNIGNADDNDAQDAGKLHVTLHHNYFKNIGARSPLARFGVIHSFNSYHQDVNSAVALRTAASGWVENSVFENCDGSIHASPSGKPSCITQSGNTFSNSAQPDVQITCPSSGKPTYSYSLDATNTVKSKVVAGAGAGKITV